MSSELVYLQCSIKVLCIKKSVLEKVPYLSGMVNFESNGTYDNPAIIDGCSYKALKSILLSAESDFKKFDEQYFPEYEYFNIDTTKLIRDIVFPYKNIEPDTFGERMKYDNKELSYEVRKNEMNLRKCIIVNNDEHLDITLDYSYYSVSSDLLKLLHNGDTIIVEKYSNYTKIFVSLCIGHIGNINAKRYYINNTSPNYINSYRIDDKKIRQIEIKSNKSYILRSTGILRIYYDYNSNPIKNIISIKWLEELSSSNYDIINYNIWKYPMNPKTNIPNRILIDKGIYYYDMTDCMDTNKIMVLQQCTKCPEYWDNSVTLLEI